MDISPWQTLDGSSETIPGQRFSITIQDFPIDFCHPSYFRQATSSMRVLLGFATGNLNGNNLARVKLLMESLDESYFPPSIHIFHQGRVSVCLITMEDQQPWLQQPPPPPSPPHDEGQIVDLGEDEPQLPLSPPYTPPWRRNNLQIPQPEMQNGGRMALAARANGFTKWSTKRWCTPGPFKEKQNKWSRTTEDVPSPANSVSSSGSNRSEVLTAYTPSLGKRKESLYTPIGVTRQELCHMSNCNHRAKVLEGYRAPRRIPNRKDDTLIQTKMHAHENNTSLYTTVHSALITKNPANNPNKTKLNNPNPSLLGPYPSSKYPNPKNPPYQLYKNLSRPNTMASSSATFSEEDELLISKFIGLHTGDATTTKILVPTSATTSTSWDLCLLLKVVTDRSVMDLPFMGAMTQAWEVDPNTIIRPVSKNCYLAEFTSTRDLYKVSLGGPWTYRGDVVASSRVASQADLKPGHIGVVNVWVQMHNIPVNSLTEEGILMLAAKIGTTVTPPVEGFVGGSHFAKVKVTLNISQPLKDLLTLTHPTLGDVLIHCSYEKASRVCRFCGLMGHEIQGCPDHQQLTAIVQERAQSENPTPPGLLAPTKGPWFNNPFLIPRPETRPIQPNITHKRPYTQSDSHNLSRVQLDSGVNMDTTMNLNHQPNLHIKRPRPAGQIPPDCDK